MTGLERYRVAAAELPRTFPLSGGDDRIITVVDGVQWWEKARTALRIGASALIVADPVGAPSGTQWQHLVKELTNVSVVCDRMLVPHGAVEKLRAAYEGQDLTEGAAAITVEVTTSPARAREALPAALGWARELARDEVAVVERGIRGASIQALLLTKRSGLPVSVRMVTSEHRRDAQIRANVLGPTRVEMSVDTSSDVVHLALEHRRGRTLLPPVYESRARAALRRSALNGHGIAELESLRWDQALASELFQS